MSDVASLDAEAREQAGKGAARALRRIGRVPAVIYGDKKDPLPISIDGQSLQATGEVPGLKGREGQDWASGKAAREVFKLASGPLRPAASVDAWASPQERP